MLSCFIVNSILPLMVKIVSSLYDIKNHEWNIAHFSYILIDALSFGLTVLACYQLIFFSYCVKIRYEFLVNFYKEHFEGIKKFDADGRDLLQLHSLIDKVIRLINSSFSKLVSTTKKENWRVVVLILVWYKGLLILVLLLIHSWFQFYSSSYPKTYFASVHLYESLLSKNQLHMLT